jgi:signal transduction histidine kinase
VDVTVVDSSGQSAVLPQAFTYMDSSLIGWWKLDGNGTDSSGSGNTGTVNGATATTDRFGTGSSAYSFNSSASNYINMGNVDNMGTGSLTVSVWFKSTQSSAGGNMNSLVVKSLYGSQVGRYGINRNNGLIQGFFADGSGNGINVQTSETPYIDGAWHLATMVYNRSGSASLYMDGALSGSTSMSAYSSVNMTNTDNLYLGVYNDTTGKAPKAGSYFNGSMDDVRIYNRALTATDVAALYSDAELNVAAVNPATGATAGGNTVTITGTGFVSGDTVSFGGVAATNVTVVNSSSITATVPAAASAGAVDVKVATSGSQSATLAGGYTYTAVPTVSGITPASGTTAGGDSVTITGTNFVSGAAVIIGGNAATAVTVVNSTTITATTPAGTAGTSDVVVTNPDGGTATLTGGFTYIIPITLTGISPSSGDDSGGDVATITGTGFVSGDTVTFGGTPATNITVTNRTYAIGSTGPAGGVIFYDKGNNDGGWRYLEAAPNDQSSGVTWCSSWTNTGASGTAVGTGQADTATIVASSCSAGAAKAATSYSGGGYSDWFLPSKDELNQLYAERSVVGGFSTGDYWSSSQGDSDPGQQAWKQNFGSGTQQAYNQETAFHVRAIREVSSDSIITATVPAVANPGAVDVTVADPTSGQSATLTGGYTYTSGVSYADTWVGGDATNPTDWWTADNWSRGRVPGSNDDAVIDGGASQPTLTMTGPYTIHSLTIGQTRSSTLTVAGGSASNVLNLTANLTIGPSGTLTHSANTTTQVNSLVVSASGDLTVASGGKIDVSGKGYTAGNGPAGVTLPAGGSGGGYGGVGGANSVGQAGGGAYGSATQPTDLGMGGGGPGGAGGGAIRLTATGTATINGTLTANGTAGGGAGGDCGGGGAGGSIWITATDITGTGSVSAKGGAGYNCSGMNGGGGAGGRVAFTYTDVLSLDGITPANGTLAGGDTVTLSGHAFHANSVVTVGGTNATVTSQNGTTLAFTTPAAGVPGPVTVSVLNPSFTGTVSNAGGTGATGSSGTAANGGTGTISPTTANQSAALTNSFTYTAGAPTIAAVTPGYVSTAGGSTITLTGTNFFTNSTVTIDGSAASMTYVNATTLQVTTPAHAAGSVDVVVTNGDGQSATASGGLTYDTPPTVSGVSPGSGLTTGGDTVTITGTGFAPNPSVTIGGSAATVVTYVNATTITAVTPSHGVGAADVTVTNGDGLAGTLSGGYTFINPPPSVTSFTPTVGKMQGGDTVTFTGSGFTSNMTAYFGGTPATTVGATSTTLTVKTPAAALGDVTMTITAPQTQTATVPGTFHYAPDAYAFTTAPLTLHATQPGFMTVEAHDKNGDTVVAPYDITLNLTSSSSGGSFSADGSTWGMTTATIPAGQSTVSFYYKDANKGAPSVTATGPAGVSVSQTETISSRYILLVTGVSDPIDAGVPSSVTVQATDWQGIAVNDYTGTIHFSSDDNYANLPTDFTITSDMRGHHTFVNGVTLVTTGEHCVTATDTSDSNITGQQCNITVNGGYSGAASKLVVITDPQSAETNTPTAAITVQVQDSSGNPAPVPVDTTVYVSSSSGSGSFSTDGVSGWSGTQPVALTIKANTTSANVYYKDSSAGTKTLSFKDESGGTDTGLTDTSQSVYIGAGAPAALAMSVSSSQPYGDWVPVRVSLKDSNGVPATNPDSPLPIYFTSDNSALQFSLDSAGSNPASSLTATIPVGGNQTTVYVHASDVEAGTITASDASPADGATGLDDASASINFIAHNPSKITLSTNATTGVDAPVAVTITQTNDLDQPAGSSSDSTIALSDRSHGGSFSLSDTNWQPVGSVTLPSGSSSVTVYYKTTTAGTVVLDASGLSEATTSLTVTPGAYTQLVFTGGPSSVPVTEATGFSVTAEDMYGNVTTVSSDTAVYLYTTSGSGSFAENANGPWTATAATIPSGGSSATFYYKDTTLGASATLTTSDQTPLDNPDSGTVNATRTITVVGQTASQLAFITAPQTITPAASSAKITVEAQKSDGSPAIQGHDLTVALSSNSGGMYGFTATADPNAAAITTVTIPAGSSSASFYYHDTQTGTHTLQATAGTLSSTQSVTITTAAASKLSFATPAQNGQTNQPSEQIEIITTDAYGNTAPVSGDTTVTLNSDCADSSFSLSSGNWSAITQVIIPDSSDTAFFYFKTSAASCTMTVSASGLTAASQVFTAATGPAQIAFSGVPASLEAGQSATVQVSLEDTAGNLVPTLSDTTVYVAASGGTVDTGSVTIRAGQSTASFTFTAGSTPGSAQLQARDEPNTGDPDTGMIDTAASLTITNPVASQLSITPANGNATVNVPQQLTIHLTNAYDIPAASSGDITVVLATDGPGSFTATSDVGAPAIATATIPAGSTTVTVYYRQTTTGTVHLAASADSLTQGTATLTVLSGQIASYQYVTAPTTAEVGQTRTFSVQALDTFGNVVTLQPGQYIYLSSSAATGSFGGDGYSANAHALVVQRSGTVASFTYQDTAVGSDTITVSDVYPLDNPDTGITNAVSTIAITAGVPAQLVFTTPQSSFERGGTSDQLAVTVENAYGIVTPVSSDTTLRLATTSPTGQFADYNTGPWVLTTVTIPANTATASFYYRDNTNTGQYTLTVSSNTLTQTSQSVTVQKGAPASLTFTTPPQTLYATHTSPAITLGVNNRYGYPTVMDASQLATFSSSSATAQFANSLPNWGSTSQTWPAGAAHITVYYRDSTSGTATLNAQVSGLSTTSQTVTVLQQVFDHFLVANISDPQVAGTPSSAVVIAQDAGDYTVAGYNGTIHFTSSDPAAVLPADYTFQPYIDKGLHTFVNGFIFSTPGEQTVTATDTATGQSGRQEAITVTSPTSPGGGTTSPESGGTPSSGGSTGSTPEQGGSDTTGSGNAGSQPGTSGSTPQTGTAGSSASGILGDAVQALGRLGKRIISSPAAPYVLPGIFYILIAAFAGLLLGDMYREVRTADMLLAILKRERQTTEDKMQFLNLVAHHVRTPITIIAGGAELAGSLLKGDATATALSDCAQRLQVTANQLVQSITSRVTGTDEAELPAQVTLERKLYLSPLFWMPVAIGLVLTGLINWLATAVGHQNVHAITIALQLLVAALVAALLYSALRGRNLRRRRKEALEQSLAHRQQLDDGKNAFIQSAGRELQGYVAELLPLDADLRQKHPAGAKPLHNGVQQLQKLVDTLNTLSSIDTTRVRTEQFELATVLDQALLAHNDQIAAKQIDVATSGNLHESLTQDQRLLSRVADTLLDNAIAFSPEGGKIRVNTSETAASTTLTITDNGPGLPKAVTNQLLQPFTHPEDTFHESHQGLGLSLYLDSLIMRHLGGSLRAHSGPKGTTITLTIPKTVLAS